MVPQQIGCHSQKCHRIVECFGLEGTFRGHPAQLPCSEQGHLQLDQVAQSAIQPGLECFHAWGLHDLSGQPVPVFHHLHCKKLLPHIQSKSTLQVGLLSAQWQLSPSATA